MPSNDNLPGRIFTKNEIAMNWAIEAARNSVRGGYDSRDDAIFYVQDVIEDEGLDVSAESIVEAEIRSLKREQKIWPQNSDFERLKLVFGKLEDDGIFAIDNLGFCQSTGIADLLELVKSYEDEGGDCSDIYGYAFFHEQDVHSAIDGEGIYLCYGNFPLRDDARAAVDVGMQVTKRLREAGFHVNWNEDIKSRIYVPIKWQRKWIENK